MRRTFGLFVLLLLGLSIFVEYDIADRSTQKLTGRKPEKNPNKKITTHKIDEKIAQAQASAKPLKFSEKFEQIARDVSVLEPEQSDEKLQVFAQTLNSHDVDDLADVLDNKNRSGDERALALEILSRHQGIDSLKELEKFVRHDHVGPTPTDTREFESVLRAQAIEGIASFPQKDLAISALSALDSKVDEIFLKDRIHRSIASLRENQNPENQTPVENTELNSAQPSASEPLHKLIE